MFWTFFLFVERFFFEQILFKTNICSKTLLTVFGQRSGHSSSAEGSGGLYWKWRTRDGRSNGNGRRAVEANLSHLGLHERGRDVRDRIGGGGGLLGPFHDPIVENILRSSFLGWWPACSANRWTSAPCCRSWSP